MQLVIPSMEWLLIPLSFSCFSLLNPTFTFLFFRFLSLSLVPPNSPRIISEDRRIETSKAIAGVYQEDEIMRLKCDVVGGTYAFVRIYKKKRRIENGRTRKSGFEKKVPLDYVACREIWLDAVRLSQGGITLFQESYFSSSKKGLWKFLSRYM